MADKIVLTEININAKGAIDEVARLRKELEGAKAKANEFKGTTEENSAAHIQAQAEYKAVAAELRTNENLLTKLTGAQKQGVGTIKQLEAENAKLRAQQSKLDLTTAEGIKLNEEYNAKINKNSAFIKNNVDQRKKEVLNIGNYPGAFGEAGAAIQKVTGVTQMLGTAFKVMLGPIGLIIAAFVALKAYFTRTEDGANKLKVIIAVFNTILQNFLDIVGKVGEAIFDAFTKPKETLQNFGKLIKENINNRIEGLMELFPALGKAIKLAFSGQFKEAGKVAGDAMAKATLGVEDMSGKIDAAKQKLTGFIEEQKREIGIAVQLANQQAALDKQIRDTTVQNAKEQAIINQLKLKAKEADKYTSEQQLAYLEKANNLILQQYERNNDIAKQKYEIKKTQNALADSNAKDLEDEANLLADVYAKESALYVMQKEVASEMQTLRKELAAKDLKEKQDKAKAAIDTMNYELSMWQLNNKSKLESSEALSDELLNNEITRLNTEASFQSEILKTQLDNKLITQQAYNLQSATLEQQNLEAIANLRNTYAEQQSAYEAERLAINYENELALQEQHIFAQLDREASKLEQMRLQEIDAANKTGADVTLINKKYAKEQEAVEKAKTDAKIGLAAGFAGNLATILGEESKAGKAAASAATAINTYQAAMAAYASLAAIPVVGVPLGIAAAGAAVATGYQNIKKIWAADATKGVSNVSDTTTGNTGATTTTTTASWDRLQSVNTDIGAGIVSRNNTSYNQNTTVLVVDDVTRAQNSQNYAAVNAEF